MSIAIIAVTRAGARLAERLAQELNAIARVPAKFAGEGTVATPYTASLADEVRYWWERSRALALIAASGIVVRTIAPLLGRKTTDPAVVCLDEFGRFVIPLIGGHQAGANDLARRIAALTGGQAVITTASDTRGLPALDLIGRNEGWRIANDSALTHAMACMVNGDLIGCWVDPDLPDARRLMDDLLALCPNIEFVDDAADLPNARFAAALLVTHRRIDDLWETLRATSVRYLPPVLVVGVGCRRGVPVDELRSALQTTLADAGLDERCVGALATAEIKAEEPGLIALADTLGVPLRVVPTAELAALDAAQFSRSAATAHFDLPGVAEPCAVIVSGGPLIVPKRAFSRCTIAVALAGQGILQVAWRVGAHGSTRIGTDLHGLLMTSLPAQIRENPSHLRESVSYSRQTAPASGQSSGVLTLVSIGPGDPQHLTVAAREALRHAEIVAGYRVYIDLIRDLLQPHQEVLVTPAMGDEVGRARQAIELARAGRRVALISSGDIGIYAMAAPVFEALRDEGWTGDDPVVEVLPGISAFQALAARLGAPVSHDFCVISLSDLLTPWEVIERRLRAAAQADFVVALYNPRSRGRDWQLDAAFRILREHRPPDTPVAFGRNVSRADEHVSLTTLAAADPSCADMFTVVLVGNSQSYVLGKWMATPRGYAARAQPMAERSGDLPALEQAPREYPIVLTNTGRLSAVVVGGGAVGERKVRGLLETGAMVRLVSPTATPQLTTWAEEGRITWLRRAYEPGDLAGALLVFAATSERAVNAQIARDAAAAGMLCNVADAPEEGQFHVPAVHRSGGVTIAVSSGGAAPARAVALRDAIARWLGDER
ncbi:MAG: precorrin-3B C(17)-methyltransferase [Roseiflexaceae bacterium]|nr:precorrin-3B C(17)-methyltransferase [Roseiflexaceae bacterium]